jgi:hypothetical protein
VHAIVIVTALRSVVQARHCCMISVKETYLQCSRKHTLLQQQAFLASGSGKNEMFDNYSAHADTHSTYTS